MARDLFQSNYENEMDMVESDLEEDDAAFMDLSIRTVPRIEGEIDLINMSEGYYVAKLSDHSDFVCALMEVHYIIHGHYLVVMKWRPWFLPSESTITKIAMWVCLLELPIELFNEEFLFSVGNQLGHTKEHCRERNEKVSAEGVPGEFHDYHLGSSASREKILPGYLVSNFDPMTSTIAYSFAATVPLQAITAQETMSLQLEPPNPIDLTLIVESCLWEVIGVGMEIAYGEEIRRNKMALYPRDEIAHGYIKSCDSGRKHKKKKRVHKKHKHHGPDSTTSGDEENDAVRRSHAETGLLPLLVWILPYWMLAQLQ
ncbi:protein of unknown function DUF4283 [Dillenia turbinata]|uniref:DUF4283 domain-containing protein n=1 Tax=Dillenia turbinata TaxID=194707 RepID=A0AAN8VA41_9MAGN